MTDRDEIRRQLIGLLREHSLVLDEVTLSSGAKASYYVDARRTVMRPEGLKAAGTLIAFILAASAWNFWPNEPPKQQPGIAVLPFAIQGGDAKEERLADGLRRT